MALATKVVPHAHGHAVGALGKPIPAPQRGGTREQRQVAAANGPLRQFLKIEALLKFVGFGGYKPVPAFIRREAAEQALVLASAGAKSLPDLAWGELEHLSDARTLAMRRGRERATTHRTARASEGPKITESVKAGLPNSGEDARAAQTNFMLEAVLEAQFVITTPPTPLRVRTIFPEGSEERKRFPDRDDRPTEQRSVVVLKAVAREAGGRPLWLAEPGRPEAMSAQVVDAGISAYSEADYATARELWLAEARSGNADAQFLVGGLYADGTGVSRSFGQAYQWWQRSGEQGHTRAQRLLPTLRGLMDEREAALVEGERKRNAT